MKITFNGKEYRSIDEMPEAERQQFQSLASTLADCNHNGVPDILEGAVESQINVSVEKKILFNGQEFSDESQLPPEVRALFDKAKCGTDVMMVGNLSGSRSPVRTVMMGLLVLLGLISLMLWLGGERLSEWFK